MPRNRARRSSRSVTRDLNAARAASTAPTRRLGAAGVAANRVAQGGATRRARALQGVLTRRRRQGGS